jgi:site-specific DNA-methyltransferase (adenine-specific)
MMCAIEDAGFEIKDCIVWAFAQGFPKSLNLGKKIDEIQGREREIVGKNPAWRPNEYTWNQGGGKTPMRPEYKDKGTSEWEGWGTALKPAVEYIAMARKPISEKNIAENVLKWGTGGLNIDISKIKDYNLEEAINEYLCLIKTLSKNG